MVVQVLQQQLPHFSHQGRRQVLARRQKMGDFTKNPGSALCGPPNHDRVGSGGCQHRLRPLGAVNVAIGHHRHLDGRLDRRHCVIFGQATVALLPGSAMDSNHLDAGLFSRHGQGHRIFVRLAPAGTHLQSDRYAMRGAGRHHSRHNRHRQRLVLHQG